MILCLWMQTEGAFPFSSEQKKGTNCLSNPNENWSSYVLWHILFYQLHSNHSWLKCMLFMNVSEGQLLSWMILDKWGSKCWQFNELQVSEHLFRGLTLSHRAFYMASALPQWLTAPWPITTFTLLIHTRPHHNFSLCRWTLGTISHWKGLGKGQLPFCMAIKQYSMCQSFLLSHIPRDFLDTI